MPYVLLTILLVAALPLGVVLALGWLGLRRTPSPFPPYPLRPPAPPARAEWRADLPAPVRRAFDFMLPDGPRVITSAVISGRATLRINGIPLQSRFRFIHEAGRNYRHYFEVTWFDRTVLRVNESFVDGYARMDLGPIGKFEGTPQLFQAATLGLWAESIWLPSVLVTDPRLRWEAVDETHARLHVPLGDGEDSLLVTFDPETGRIASFDALRYRDAAEGAVKLGWHCLVGQYGSFDGARVPATASIQWSDMKAPWAEWMVEEVVINADVHEAVRTTGP